MEKENLKEKKIKKIGRTTFGITLVIVGIVILLQLVLKLNIIKYVLMCWPVILILLGIEVLYYSRRDEINIKYDIAGIILTFLVLFASSIFSLITFSINKLSDIDKKQMINSMVDSNYNMSFDSGVEVINLTDGKVNIKEQINNDISTTYVVAKVKYKDSFEPDVFDVINNNCCVYNFIQVDEKETTFAKISIVDVPDYIESVEFTITARNEGFIQTSGNINIVK